MLSRHEDHPYIPLACLYIYIYIYSIRACVIRAKHGSRRCRTQSRLVVHTCTPSRKTWATPRVPTYIHTYEYVLARMYAQMHKEFTRAHAQVSCMYGMYICSASFVTRKHTRICTHIYVRLRFYLEWLPISWEYSRYRAAVSDPRGCSSGKFPFKINCSHIRRVEPARRGARARVHLRKIFPVSRLQSIHLETRDWPTASPHPSPSLAVVSSIEPRGMKKKLAVRLSFRWSATFCRSKFPFCLPHRIFMLPVGFPFRRARPPAGNRGRNCGARRNINAACWSDFPVFFSISKVECDPVILFHPLFRRPQPICTMR